MSGVASIISDLVKAGVDPDLVGRVASALAQREPIETRTSRQIRNARYYERKASEKRLNASEQDISDDIKTVDPGAYIARADAPVCSNDISNEISILDTPLPSEGPQGEVKPEKQKSGTCLPDDWSPPEELFAYGAERGLSRSHTAEIIEGMRLWAKANRNQAKARKADWLAAMQGAIRRDAPKFNARAGPAVNRGGVGKLLYESLETHGDLTNEKRETGHVDGSKKTGIAQDVCRLPFDGMPRRNDDPEHDRVVSGNPVGLLIGNSYRRM
jgi:hypothetical protein